MSPLGKTAQIASDQQGFTLIEMLVAILTGLIVTFATFSILDVSLSQSSRIADRVSADQRSRTAMENILLELHSSCVSINENPILEGSKGENIKFISQTGPEPAFTTVRKHEIFLSGGTLKDTYTTSNVSATGSKWTFPVTATGTTTLLTGVSQSGATPIFQYYRYYKSTDASPVLGTLYPTALATPLGKEDAQTTAKVTVSFTTAPESSNSKADRSVELSDSVSLRLTPSVDVGRTEPCE
jgi:prepilin-type N-terminal cleavage/methylation domain-containing protein